MKANKALHRKAIPLRSIAAGELYGLAFYFKYKRIFNYFKSHVITTNYNHLFLLL